MVERLKSHRDMASDGDWSALGTAWFGRDLGGWLVAQRPDRCWVVEADPGGPTATILLKDRMETQRKVGDPVRGWIWMVDESRNEVGITDDLFGRLPISDGQRAKYRRALSTTVAVLAGAVPTDADKDVSELKGMFNRSLRKDQHDWLAVYDLFDRPSRERLHQLALEAAELREALTINAHRTLAVWVARWKAEGVVELLSEAGRRLESGWVRLPASRVQRATTVPAPSRTPRVEMHPVDLVKLDAARNAHETVLEVLREHLERAGYVVEENVHVDAFARLRTGPAIFEAKSINAWNEVDQCRAALSQLYEYRYRFDRSAGLWIVLSQKLSGATDWMLDYFHDDRGVGVLWLDEKYQLVGPWLSRLTETVFAANARKSAPRSAS
jgi:hypothetical protein